MTKLRNPLFSLNARNTLGKAISYVRRRSQNIAEVKPVPDDPKTLAQLSWRHMYQKAVALWTALSAAEQQDWESQARRRQMTGFAWFMSQALKPNPGLYLPLQGGTMQGNIDMAKFQLLHLPLPTDDQEAASKKYVDDSLPPGGYTEGARVYHNIDQAIPNVTATVVAFNSERYDTDAIHDPIVNNSRLTCKTPGTYLPIANTRWEDNPNGDRFMWIRKNGAAPIALARLAPSPVERTSFSLSTTYILALTDYLELVVYQTSGGALNLETYAGNFPAFIMQRIG